MSIYKTNMEEYQILTAKINSLEKAISELPDGKLLVQKNGNAFRHYNRVNQKRIYLPLSSRETIEALAKKRYLQNMLLDVRDERDAVEKYLKNHKEENRAQHLLSENPHIAELLEPLFMCTEERHRKWADEEYPSTTEHPEHLIHVGPRGKMYRSKSESLIAHALYNRKVAYRYEWDKTIFDITYHIDFTIKHPKSGRLYYWEHFGSIDKPGYAMTIGEKIYAYESVGIVPGKNLIMTFESRKYPFNMSDAEEMVEKWFFNES